MQSLKRPILNETQSINISARDVANVNRTKKKCREYLYSTSGHNNNILSFEENTRTNIFVIGK